ncbi:cytochrome c oxidase assembly protein [uncultured Microbacterium sp.]|uniref:cytochrome c oxidase assembly protein n=1 Tax=uncultured Microbacterium sp. TaxID=191216 RepID=UPI0025D88FE3|nr:cytochrome c oxidase assembly protein [uncultured Microbacterium sp.]
MDARALRLAGPALLVVVAVLVAVFALAFGGGASQLTTADPGPVVRWGLPLANLGVNLSASLMAGPLVLALFALRAGTRPFSVALDTASIGAACFTISAAATGYFSFLQAFNAQPNLGNEFGSQLGRFLTELPLGQAWLLTTLAGAALTVLTFAVRSWTATLIVAALALASIIPMATTSHSGEAANHTVAVTSLALHIVAAAVWVGGLVMLVVVRPAMAKERRVDASGVTLIAVLRRYSSIALVAFVVVAVSGYARALVGIGAWEQLATPWGILLLVKIGALLALGVLGALYRTRLIGRIAAQDQPVRRAASRTFWALVTLELALMGIASGAAAALARTAPPVVDQAIADPTPAEVLTGAPLPPEPTVLSWFTAYRIDPLWALVAAFALFFYLAAVWRLHRRGDAWPIARTISWCAGIVLFFWVTCGPVAVYENYLFSVHMTGHMLLSMAIPMLLVPGAPVSLAARAIHKRDDGTRGGREWILWAVHTPFARVITNPFVTAGFFVGSLWAFYYTDLFRWALYDHIGHIWMVVHFMITGYLFVQSLIGIDPVPFRLPYAGRLITLIAVMALHAFFGVSIMMQSGLFVAEWFGSMGRTWGQTPFEDQYVGGGVAWSIGEIPTLILAITVAIQWSRSDARLQRRRDRQVERAGDVELDEYNEKLRRLAERDAAASGR